MWKRMARKCQNIVETFHHLIASEPHREDRPACSSAQQGVTSAKVMYTSYTSWDPKAPTRFIGDQRTNEAQFIQAAREYSQKTAAKFPWHPEQLATKPYSVGDNESFFRLMTTSVSLLKSLDLPPSSKVLEVGSGPGWLTEMMLKMGWRVHCIEPDANMAEIARQKCLRSFPATEGTNESDFSIFVGSLEEADLKAGDFDAVVFFDSLHHIPDEAACFKTCHDALREGGLIAISEGAWVPGAAHLENALREEMEQSGTLENPFTRSYLDHCLRKAGFSAIERFVWPQILIQENFASSPMSFGLLGMPDSTNFLIATKKFAGIRQEWDVAWNLCQASWDAARQILAVDVEIRNEGLHVWRAGPDPGAVNVGLRASIAEYQVMYPLGILPRRVFPGEILNFRHEFAVGADGGTTDFVLDLVNAQRFWFSQLGCSVCSLGKPTPRP